ncbi:hypothetical protein VTK73DRAFT_2047 [Phialemonium thermophilum]|uniref:Uncharacterized protein n=1 Tax=Phialemonium thermophilum TaxID=223376 RepID=A0ABR3VSM1_9PEZI
MCLCKQIKALASAFDELEAERLVAALNSHLQAIRDFCTKSKSLANGLRYEIGDKQQLSSKISTRTSLDTTRQERILRAFQAKPSQFWQPVDDDATHMELGRRLACVLVYLRYRLFNEVHVPSAISLFAPGAKSTDLRYAGKKFIGISRQLGGIGSLLSFPLDIPSSTYERYVPGADQKVVEHFKSIGVVQKAQLFDRFAKDLVKHQLQDEHPPSSYYALAAEYDDLLTDADQLLLLFRALGGADIPDFLIRSVQGPQLRWEDDGQLRQIDARQAGLPSELCCLLSSDDRREQALASSQFILQEATNEDYAS